MDKNLLSILATLFVLFGSLCNAQTTFEVSDPRLEYKENTLYITYDILNGDSAEKYVISLDIHDESGNRINAETLEGDIGEIESGGYNKRIIWDLKADNIFINSFINVTINVKVIPPSAPVVLLPPEESQKEELNETEEKESINENLLNRDDSEISESSTSNRSKSYNRTAIIFQSLALPGLGLSRVTGRPHWIRGVLGYGCIAGSVILNRQAVNTFNNIETLTYIDDINDAYDKSLRQDNISEILAYAAIGVWVTDIIWTIAGTSDLKRPNFYSQSKGFSIRSSIEPQSGIPLVSLRYTF